MRKRFSAILVTASMLLLVLLAVTVTLQWRHPGLCLGFLYSHYYPESRVLNRTVLIAQRGGLWLIWGRSSMQGAGHQSWSEWQANRPRWYDRIERPGGYISRKTFLGFFARAGLENPGTRYSIWLRIPYWFIALASLLPPALAVKKRLRRRRRIKAGRCPACGYDLRASGSRCPECGLDPGPGSGTAASETSAVAPSPPSTPR